MVKNMNNGIFAEEIELRFCDCDYKKRFKLSAIMSYMADIAGLSYADKGYSHSWLWENSFVFLLSRVSIHINRTPKSDEKITVNTWERETKGVLFFRDFQFVDEAGLVVIEASTAWVLANPHTRQIVRPSAFTGKVDSHPEKKADVSPPGRIVASNELVHNGDRVIVYSDIDANGHVYNAIYAAIACDFIDNNLIEKDISDFKINFKQEAKLGEILSISSAHYYDEFEQVYLCGEVGSSLSFECQIGFFQSA